MDTASTERQLSLSARWTLVCRSDDRLVLVAEDDIRLIEDPLIREIVETLPDPESALTPRYPVDRIRAAIVRMRDDGILSCGLDLSAPAAAYWDSASCPPPRGAIAFDGLCSFGSDLIAKSLCNSGLAISESAPRRLVTVDDYLDPALDAIDRDRRPWMLAKPIGHTIWLGPVFGGETPCWECLSGAIKSHRWPQAAFTGWRGEAYPPQRSIAGLPTTEALAAGWIATAALAWTAKGDHPELSGAILTLDTRTMRQSRHVVRGRRGCPRCDPSSSRARVTFPDFVSPITGVLSELEVSAAPELGLFHAQGLFVAPLPQGRMRGFPRLQRSAGKAASRDRAAEACVAEALERYSLIYQGNETTVGGRIDLHGGLSPEDVLLFSDSQYRDRANWNASHAAFHWVPERFDPAEEIEWTEATSLLTGRIRLAPTGLCYMYYPFDGGRKFCSPDTNGCAAGQSIQEAQLHGLLELIERDAVAIWWYNRIRRPAAPIGAFGGSKFRNLTAAFAAAGRSIALLDITTDIQIPAYAAVTALADGTNPCFGAAAAVSPAVAAFKAVAEAAQICFWLPRESKENEMIAWSNWATLENSSYLVPCGDAGPVQDLELSTGEALELCLRELERAGADPLSIDLTRPEIGLPVVRTFAPGLRHCWARFGPGRLYSVPQSLGWLDRPLTESELNPTACML